MKIASNIFLMGLVFLFISCETKIETKVIKSTYNNQIIGDSIIVDGKLRKIVFNGYGDGDVDSIVFVQKRGNIVEQKSYYNGRPTYENIQYDKKNGNIKKYIFQSPQCDTCLFVRIYDEEGKPLSDSGKIFFLVRVDKINPSTLEVKDDGTRMHMWIYFPNPPKGHQRLYALSNNNKVDVFKQNEAIPYIMEAWLDTKKGNKEFSIASIGMDFKAFNGEILEVKENVYYKVVDW
jgi:hypothetical protein